MLGFGIVAAVLVVAAVVALVPIDHTLSCSCVLDASHRWTFSEMRPGTFVSRSVNNIAGQTEQFRLFQFDRPAFLDIRFASLDFGEDAAPYCTEGQMLASVSSSALNIEMAERHSDLDRSRAVLEVRSHDVPFILDDGQIVARFVFEHMIERPDEIYGQDIGSNYQAQGLKLSKHFVM